MEDYRVDINHDGIVEWNCGSNLATSCILDVSDFPFDKQECSIIVENAVYTAEQVDLESEYPIVELGEFHETGVWRIDKTTAEKITYLTDDGEAWPKIIYTLYLSRKSDYYVLNLLLPSLLITMVALSMFWLPADSGEKVSLGITIMLAYSVMLLVIESYMPVTSDHRPKMGKMHTYLIIDY